MREVESVEFREHDGNNEQKQLIVVVVFEAKMEKNSESHSNTLWSLD